MVRILTAWLVSEARPCGLRPSLLGHAPVTSAPTGDTAQKGTVERARLRPRGRERTCGASCRMEPQKRWPPHLSSYGSFGFDKLLSEGDVVSSLRDFLRRQRVGCKTENSSQKMRWC